MILLKSPAEIEKMHRAGDILADLHEALREVIQPGIMTRELDAWIDDRLHKAGAISSFKGYQGYPASACISINEEVVHGIPGKRRLEEGDIVSVDLGAYIDGYHADCARTFPVGKISGKAEHLVQVTRESFFACLDVVRPGNRIGDIGYAVQSYAEQRGYSVVRELTGHGIGKALHEEPNVPNFGKPGRGPRLSAGMVIAIEPMINAGKKEVLQLEDGWTVITADGSLSAHYENTVAVMPKGPPLILTERFDVV